MKKSLFVLFCIRPYLLPAKLLIALYSELKPYSTAKMAETFALTFVIAALYLFARYKVTRLLMVKFFAFSIIANNVHYAVYQS